MGIEFFGSAVTKKRGFSVRSSLYRPDTDFKFFKCSATKAMKICPVNIAYVKKKVLMLLNKTIIILTLQM
jgi:hypothetical protein